MKNKKPETFEDLLNLQKILDENTAKIRENGFVPRERTEIDILLALDDEFQEWLKELPQEYNFKTWKQKEYSREKELEELTDILFFYLQYINFKKLTDDEILDFSSNFYCIGHTISEYSKKMNLIDEIWDFKSYLWDDMVFNFESYTNIAILRGFSDNEILNKYWEKWQKNMNRISEDWTLKKI